MREEQPTVVLDTVGTRSRKGRRVLVGLLVTVLALILAAAAAIYMVTESVGNNVSRVPDAFAGIPAEARPAASSGTTFLLTARTPVRPTRPPARMRPPGCRPTRSAVT
ncbi:hypothetical protein ACQP04_29330 [Pseudonocardia halophobica]|uniref:hypothetical protein n=1 Tax=Pseudonocardia halophobica TaxID=29401 RepID=UPI003D8D9B7E